MEQQFKRQLDELPDDSKQDIVVTPSAYKSIFWMGLVVIILLILIVAVNVQKSAKKSVKIDQMSQELSLYSGSDNQMLSQTKKIEPLAQGVKQYAESILELARMYDSKIIAYEQDIISKNRAIKDGETIRESMLNSHASDAQELKRLRTLMANQESNDKMLSQLRLERDQLLNELANLRQNLTNKVSDVQFADVQKQLEEMTSAKLFFEQKVQILEQELAKLRLFAKSENELLPKAQELFRRLKPMENVTDSDLMTAYSNLGVELGSSVMSTLVFETGSSSLSDVERDKLNVLLQSTPEDDLLLVIGYASVTGDANANQKLSSDRATVVAEYLASIKKPNQMVQAVYLGQTSRFSSRIPERNQLCEVWRIRNK